uniref:peptidyl-tRNA hydrolase n=1 Tax=Oncorhynchus kisutch TaxID=8019 RepID=A0A8C7JHX7_ONCKI
MGNVSGGEADASFMGEEFKMILVVRSELKMGMGKVVAQCSHAAVSLQAGPAQKPRATDAMGVLWAAEIVVKAPYEDSLIELLTHAKVGLSAPRCREDTDSTRVPYCAESSSAMLWTLH